MRHFDQHDLVPVRLHDRKDGVDRDRNPAAEIGAQDEHHRLVVVDGALHRALEQGPPVERGVISAGNRNIEIRIGPDRIGEVTPAAVRVVIAEVEWMGPGFRIFSGCRRLQTQHNRGCHRCPGRRGLFFRQWRTLPHALIARMGPARLSRPRPARRDEPERVIAEGRLGGVQVVHAAHLDREVAAVLRMLPARARRKSAQQVRRRVEIVALLDRERRAPLGGVRRRTLTCASPSFSGPVSVSTSALRGGRLCRRWRPRISQQVPLGDALLFPGVVGREADDGVREQPRDPRQA